MFRVDWDYRSGPPPCSFQDIASNIKKIRQFRVENQSDQAFLCSVETITKISEWAFSYYLSRHNDRSIPQTGDCRVMRHMVDTLSKFDLQIDEKEQFMIKKYLFESRLGLEQLDLAHQLFDEITKIPLEKETQISIRFDLLNKFCKTAIEMRELDEVKAALFECSTYIVSLEHVEKKDHVGQMIVLIANLLNVLKPLSGPEIEKMEKLLKNKLRDFGIVYQDLCQTMN